MQNTPGSITVRGVFSGTTDYRDDAERMFTDCHPE